MNVLAKNAGFGRNSTTASRRAKEDATRGVDLTWTLVRTIVTGTRGAISEVPLIGGKVASDIELSVDWKMKDKQQMISRTKYAAS